MLDAIFIRINIPTVDLEENERHIYIYMCLQPTVIYIGGLFSPK